MVLGATVYIYQIALNDADRNVYESLEFRVARHPSETAEYLVTRVLAYCLEYGAGLVFSKGGLSDPDAPALEIRDLTGALKSWIEIGAPDAARLHKATKVARRVVVYSHKDVTALIERIESAAVHRAEQIELYTFDRDFIAGFVARLDRRMRFDLAVTDRQLYLSVGKETLSGGVILRRPGG